ncbi:hypothetical protein IKX12_03935 [Candidatus Saccharibacteria bacterium]|nr:hypothetical protein [Candidatus Saccharibacteria bacterium]
MKMYLDTSTPETILRLNDQEYEWESGRSLARDLLKFIHDKLVDNNCDWKDLESITFFAGPGSFTGLRIGATVVNTLSQDLHIPLYDQHGQQHQIILPEYGRPANITPPKK